MDQPASQRAAQYVLVAKPVMKPRLETSDWGQVLWRPRIRGSTTILREQASYRICHSGSGAKVKPSAYFAAYDASEGVPGEP